MTIIAAAENEKLVCIGSDSTGVLGDILIEAGPKLIKKGNYIIGFSDSFRVADIILESDKFPKTINSLLSIRKFRDILKLLLIEDGCTEKSSNEDTILHPVSLIIICPIGIYTIESDYQIHKVNKYIATGSGMSFALGALNVLTKLEVDPKTQVTLAIEATIMHCTSCSGNVYIETIKKRKNNG